MDMLPPNIPSEHYCPSLGLGSRSEWCWFSRLLWTRLLNERKKESGFMRVYQKGPCILVMCYGQNWAKFLCSSAVFPCLLQSGTSLGVLVLEGSCQDTTLRSRKWGLGLGMKFQEVNKKSSWKQAKLGVVVHSAITGSGGRQTSLWGHPGLHTKFQKSQCYEMRTCLKQS